MEWWGGWHRLILDSRSDLLSQSASDASCAPDIFIQSSVSAGSLSPFLKLSVFICSSVWAASNSPTSGGQQNGQHKNVPCFRKIQTDIKPQPWRRDLGCSGESRECYYATVPPNNRQPLLKTASFGFGSSLRSLFPAWEKVAQCAGLGFDESPILLSSC